VAALGAISVGLAKSKRRAKLVKLFTKFYNCCICRYFRVDVQAGCISLPYALLGGGFFFDRRCHRKVP
jgi:hypothetical protein